MENLRKSLIFPLVVGDLGNWKKRKVCDLFSVGHFRISGVDLNMEIDKWTTNICPVFNFQL
jgi:hypothetical protein